jgi:hypothetical protein
MVLEAKEHFHQAKEGCRFPDIQRHGTSKQRLAKY